MRDMHLSYLKMQSWACAAVVKLPVRGNSGLLPNVSKTELWPKFRTFAIRLYCQITEITENGICWLTVVAASF